MKITETQLRRIIREEIVKESLSGPSLDDAISKNRLRWTSSADRWIQDWGTKKSTAVKYAANGRDIAAIYLSLPIDLPIDKVARKVEVVRGALGSLSPADAYERDPAALQDAIAAAGLTGRASDRLRSPADKYY